MCIRDRYVDDILLTGSNVIGIQNTLQLLQKRYKIRILGYPSQFLNIHIVKTETGKLFLHQTTYIELLLKKLNIEDCDLIKVPIVPFSSQNTIKVNSQKLNLTYRQIIGALLFVANFTRPDITYAVNFLARYQVNPLELQWTLLKILLLYLSGTKSLGILFDCTGVGMDVFVDADYGGDPQTRRSTTGYVVRLFGCPVTWASRIQSCIAESSAEAENNAICDATHDVLLLARLSEEAMGESFFPVTLYEDNNAAISISTKSTKKSRVKHVELKFLKVREYVSNKMVKIVKVASENQLADIFTKGLKNEVFLKLRDSLMSSNDALG